MRDWFQKIRREEDRDPALTGPVLRLLKTRAAVTVLVLGSLVFCAMAVRGYAAETERAASASDLPDGISLLPQEETLENDIQPEEIQIQETQFSRGDLSFQVE